MIELRPILERAVAEAPREDLPAIAAALEAARTRVLIRLLEREPESAKPAEDESLDAKEAARRLGVSTDWLYEKSKAGKVPFAIRIGPRKVRFSARGLERWKKQRQGV